MTLPTKYNPKKHPQQLLELMKQGKDVCHFCAENLIVRSTFYLWVKENADFKEAFDLGKSLAEAWWQDAACNNLINPSIWARMMTVKFNYPSERAVKLKGFKTKDTFNDKAKAVQKLLKQGVLTPSEANNITNTIHIAANINEKTEVAQDAKEILGILKK